eukprot:UN07003
MNQHIEKCDLCKNKIYENEIDEKGNDAESENKENDIKPDIKSKSNHDKNVYKKALKPVERKNDDISENLLHNSIFQNITSPIPLTRAPNLQQMRRGFMSIQENVHINQDLTTNR